MLPTKCERLTAYLDKKKKVCQSQDDTDTMISRVEISEFVKKNSLSKIQCWELTRIEIAFQVWLGMKSSEEGNYIGVYIFMHGSYQ